MESGSTARGNHRSRGVARLLLIAGGKFFVLCAAVYNAWTVEFAGRTAGSVLHRPILTPDAGRIHHAQVELVVVGVALLLAAWLVGRFARLDRFFRKSPVEKWVLALLVVAVPLVAFELSLRPFLPDHEKTTSLFVKDDQLGWKLRPGAVDQWGDVEVCVNERGFRGPVIPYQKKPGVTRIAYLGDSVTFGYRVARWENTYPFVVEGLLESTDSLSIETINLAVEGYSQWQQAIVLSDEGDRYDPDLVVVGFVLNDVTEMFHLARFGGADEGFQLRHSYTSRWDRLLSKSALVYEIQNVVREMKAKRKLGDDLRLGAIRQQALDVETLMTRPDQANVKTAWDIALTDLQGIVDHCAARGVPVLVVVFPFTVQLSDPVGLSAPQSVIGAYADARGIPTLDLLPALAEYSRATGTTASELFLDHDHLSVEGHRVVATMIAQRIAGLLDGQSSLAR